MIYELFKNIFTNEDILVVDGDFEPEGRGLVQAININGGKSICLQHGTFSERLFPTYVKNYFVWGNHFKIDIGELFFRLILCSARYLNLLILG